MRRLVSRSAAALLTLVLAAPLLAEPTVAPSSSAESELERRRERLLRELRQRGVPLPSTSGAWPTTSFELPRTPPAPSATASGGAVRSLAQRWREFAESRPARRERNLAALQRQLGPRLSDPGVQRELALHATRVAQLERLKFLAHNARTGSKRERLLARIERLTALEARRHQREIERIGTTGDPGAAQSSSPPPRAVPR